MVSRRGVLVGAGAVNVLVVAGVVWRASEEGVFSIGQGPTYEPWQTWRTDSVVTSSDGSWTGAQRSAQQPAVPRGRMPPGTGVAGGSIEPVYADVRDRLMAMSGRFDGRKGSGLRC